MLTDLHDEARLLPRVLVHEDSADVAEYFVYAAEEHRAHEPPGAELETKEELCNRNNSV